MNMERVEERCLAFLRQSQNPLVLVEQLLEYCKQEEEIAELSREVLMAFLRAHSDIHVLEGPEDHEAINLQQFATAGLMMGPRAILFSRVPAPQEMTAILAAQLSTMMETLGEAFVKAEKEGDAAQAGKIREAMAQAEDLRTRLKIFVSHEKK